MGRHRFNAISQAHYLGDAQLETLFSVIRERLASLLEFGAMTAVDEAVYAYYGDDMREDAVDIKIEGKLHPYGLFNYFAT